MNDNLGRDKIQGWKDEWSMIDKHVAKEHDLTSVATKFLTPPIPDKSGLGTVPADEVISGEDGILSIDESETRTVIEIAVQFRVRQNQAVDEKIAVSLAIRAANLLARAEDLIIFQGIEAALKDSLFTSKSVILNSPKLGSRNNNVDSFLSATCSTQVIEVLPVERNNINPNLSIYGENIYAAVAQGYTLLQKHHYGRQVLILPSTIHADTYATRTTTLDIPAVTYARIQGLIGEHVYGTSTLPSFDDPAKIAKGILLALDGNTFDLIVQQDPITAVVTQESSSKDYIFQVFERFALRLKDPLAVVELHFLPQEATSTKTK